jgi:hypothetical protein
MEYTALDLITRSLYSRDIDDDFAVQELIRLGWSFPLRVLALIVLTLLILPERLICGLGGDDWDNGPTEWRDIAFSTAFSQLILMPLLFAWETYQLIFGSGAIPIFSPIVFGVSYVYINYVYQPRA